MLQLAACRRFSCVHCGGLLAPYRQGWGSVVVADRMDSCRLMAAVPSTFDIICLPAGVSLRRGHEPLDGRGQAAGVDADQV